MRPINELPILPFHNFFVQNTHAINLRNNQTVYCERARTKFSSKLPPNIISLLFGIKLTPQLKQYPQNRYLKNTNEIS